MRLSSLMSLVQMQAWLQMSAGALSCAENQFTPVRFKVLDLRVVFEKADRHVHMC